MVDARMAVVGGPHLLPCGCDSRVTLREAVYIDKDTLKCRHGKMWTKTWKEVEPISPLDVLFIEPEERRLKKLPASEKCLPR